MSDQDAFAATARAAQIAGAALSNVTAALTGASFRFDVFVGSLGLGEWTKCDGLQVDYQVSTYQTAMNPDENNIASPRIWNYLSRPSYKEITLSRPCTATGMLQTSTWLKQMWYSPIPEYGHIFLYNAAKLVIYKWGLLGVVPGKWSGPNLDIDGGKIGIETLVLAHEGWDWSI